MDIFIENIWKSRKIATIGRRAAAISFIYTGIALIYAPVISAVSEKDAVTISVTALPSV